MTNFDMILSKTRDECALPGARRSHNSNHDRVDIWPRERMSERCINFDFQLTLL